MAEHAVMRLLDVGIVARVVGHHASEFSLTLQPALDVMILNKEDTQAAEAVLDVFDAEAAAGMLMDDPEGAEFELPDLSRLDPELYAAQCPACDNTLPMDASLEHCPYCGQQVDVAALITQAHGPEALMQAYDNDDDDPTPDSDPEPDQAPDPDPDETDS